MKSTETTVTRTINTPAAYSTTNTMLSCGVGRRDFVETTTHGLLPRPVIDDRG
jgi:hypothetical protein